METGDELKEMLINNAASWGDKEGDEMAEIYVNDFLDELLAKFKLLPIQHVSFSEERAEVCDQDYPEKKVPKNMGYGKGGDMVYI